MNTKHNKRFTPEYNSWFIMKQRCYNPKAYGYKYYGGKGIKVCDEWLDDFGTFYQNMGPKPSDKCGLSRKDPEEDFNPENCIWIERRKPNKLFVEKDGENLSLKDWSIKLGVPYQTLRHRYHKFGSTEEILHA
jgi:hypothetical protein